MKYSLIIDPDREEEIIVISHKENQLTKKIFELINSLEEPIVGFKDKETIILDLSEIVCFVSDAGKVFAHTLTDKFLIKERIYQIEERITSDFIKINQSCIANIKMIRNFSAKFNGSLQVVFKNGYCEYVSRRQIKAVKERMGI